MLLNLLLNKTRVDKDRMLAVATGEGGGTEGKTEKSTEICNQQLPDRQVYIQSWEAGPSFPNYYVTEELEGQGRTCTKKEIIVFYFILFFKYDHKDLQDTPHPIM